MKLTIESNLLKAVAHFAAKKDMRKYLCGVRVETSPTHIRLTATDGHAMLTLRTPYSGKQCEPFTVPIELLSKLPAKGAVAIGVDDDKILLTVGNSATSAPKIEGCFPDYRFSIPEKTNGETAFYSPLLLAKFAASAEALYGKAAPNNPIQIMQNGASGAVVIFPVAQNAEALGVIMPCRGNIELLAETPAWAKQ